MSWNVCWNNNQIGQTIVHIVKTSGELLSDSVPLFHLSKFIAISISSNVTHHSFSVVIDGTFLFWMVKDQFLRWYFVCWRLIEHGCNKLINGVWRRIASWPLYHLCLLCNWYRLQVTSFDGKKTRDLLVLMYLAGHSFHLIRILFPACFRSSNHSNWAQ